MQDMNEIEIEIDGMIGDADPREESRGIRSANSYREVRRILSETSGTKDRKIIVNIRSIGGSVEEALLIYDALRECGSPVATRCFGYAASAATIIAQAADRGQREVSANSLYLIHKASCRADGNSREFSRTLDLLDKTDRRISLLYARCSGKPESHFIELMEWNDGKGRWLTPEETIGQGLADRIISSSAISNEARRQVLDSHLPPLPKSSEKTENSMENLRNLWQSLVQQLKKEVKDPSLEENVENASAPPHDPVAEQIRTLEDRVRELEADNAKLLAKATRTLPKEDPSVDGYRRDANSLAYEDDIHRIKTNQR